MPWRKALGFSSTLLAHITATAALWLKRVQKIKPIISMCEYLIQQTIERRLQGRRTGETPWVFEMIQKYHSVAKDNKTIVG